MLETFTALLTAHLIAEFALDQDWRLKKSIWLVAHIALVGAGTVILLGTYSIWMLLPILAAHLVIDGVSMWLPDDSARRTILEQAVYLSLLFCLSAYFPNELARGWWGVLGTNGLNSYLGVLCMLSGIIVNLQVGAILIKKVVLQFTSQIQNNIVGLEDGGLYIGLLERALVMLLIFIGQPAGVGFLITAKSILRFGDVKDAEQRKSTEYIIIGTFMSFGWGLLISVLTQGAVRHYVQW